MGNTKSIADVLNEAADAIERRGWCQSTYSRGEKFCVMGAIYDACGTGPITFDRTAEAAERFLEKLVPPPGNNEMRAVTEWNDAEERTQAEVVAKLREAAALARAEGR